MIILLKGKFKRRQKWKFLSKGELHKGHFSPRTLRRVSVLGTGETSDCASLIKIVSLRRNEESHGRDEAATEFRQRQVAAPPDTFPGPGQ